MHWTKQCAKNNNGNCVLPARNSWTKRFKYEEGKIPQIVQIILDTDHRYYLDTKELSKKVERSREGLKKLFYFIREHVKYVADKTGKEVVKGPSQTWNDGFGDCKSFSIFVASVLKNKGIPYYYKFVGYRNWLDPSEETKISHVYVVAKLKGRNIILDTTIPEFNKEYPYDLEYKKKPISDAIRGPGRKPNLLFGALIFAGIGFAFFKTKKKKKNGGSLAGPLTKSCS